MRSLPEILKRSPLFSVLEDAERESILQVSLTRSVAKEVLLFSLGEPCREVLVILRGAVRLWRPIEDGHTLILHRCGPGEVLGQMSVLDEAPHSVSATSDEECELLRVQAATFRDLLAQRPLVALRLATLLAQRVRDLSEELEGMKFSSLSSRVARKLSEVGAGRREVRLTHQAIAQEVGATRENVSRALSQLQAKGAILLRRGAIEILDHSLLTRE